MKRLFEDSQLSAELRQDLLRSRVAGQDYPTSAKLLQLRAALSDPARQPLPEPSPLAAAFERLAWRASHPAWKLVALVAIGGAGAWMAHTIMQAPTAGSPPPTAELKHVLQPVAAVPQPAEEPNVAEVVAPALPEPAAASRPAPAANSSRREIAQLVRIRALLDQDPAAAYQLSVRSEREHPRGVLSEERRALAIVALAKLGDKQAAQRKAREFFLRYPQSPMRDVIEAALRR